MFPRKQEVTNVQGGLNSRVGKTVALIEKADPDLVGMTEITPTWADSLTRRLEKRYPYSVVEPRLGGVAIYSKLPLVHSEVRYFGAIRRPRILAELRFEGKALSIVFAHPVIPLPGRTLRDQELELIGKECAERENPTILFGDLNTTCFSFYFGRLLAESGLLDSELGFGWQPSWSVRWPVPLFPIDHLLASPDFSVLERRTLEPVGSDHLPVWVVLSLDN
ncbi:MAG: endonuclease/exonuclease/phosphatase family protein [Candidatus Obscuribacterales bacterium]